MSIEQVTAIYSTALHKLTIARGLKSLKLSKLKSVISKICQLDSPLPTNVNQPVSDIEHKLNEFGLTLQHSAPDGNCFFNSIVQNVNTNRSNWDAVFPHTINQTALRQMFVSEITGERHLFLPGVCMLHN